MGLKNKEAYNNLEYDSQSEACHEIMVRLQALHAAAIKVDSYIEQITRIMIDNSLVEFEGLEKYQKVFRERVIQFREIK